MKPRCKARPRAAEILILHCPPKCPVYSLPASIHFSPTRGSGSTSPEQGALHKKQMVLHASVIGCNCGGR